MDISRHCRPDQLTVYGRFTRRGGIDINPFRSTDETVAPAIRLPRQ
jgi:7-cyano-7-deazaguanine reductase